MFIFNFFSVEPIHKYIYVYIVCQPHIFYRYVAFSGFQLTKINEIYNSSLDYLKN